MCVHIPSRDSGQKGSRFESRQTLVTVQGTVIKDEGSGGNRHRGGGRECKAGGGIV